MSGSAAHQYELKTVDGSGRISLGKAKAGALYAAVYEADGRVILTPMVAIPEREAWLHQNPTAKAMVLQGLEEMATGETASIDLSSYPDDEEA